MKRPAFDDSPRTVWDPEWLWRRSVSEMPAELLVAAFTFASADLSSHETATACGLSSATVQRLRRGEWNRLNSATREALRAALIADPFAARAQHFVNERRVDINLDDDVLRVAALVVHWTAHQDPILVATRIGGITAADILGVRASIAALVFGAPIAPAHATAIDRTVLERIARYINPWGMLPAEVEALPQEEWEELQDKRGPEAGPPDPALSDLARTEDRELVEQFLAVTEQLSTYEAERETGVSSSSMQRLRTGEWSRLRSDTRERMLSYLVQHWDAVRSHGARRVEEKFEFTDVLRLIQRTRHMSPEAVAERLRSHGAAVRDLPSAVEHWRSLVARHEDGEVISGWSPPDPQTMEAIRSFVSAYNPDDPNYVEGQELDPYFPAFRWLVPFLRNLGDPGQASERKMDALRGVRDIVSVVGPVPEWWYSLRERIERGEL